MSLLAWAAHPFSLVLALAAAAAPAPSVTPFRTEAAPRIDPVFGGVPALRKSIDQFLSLQAEMEQVRDDFSTAVHETLADLVPSSLAPGKASPRPAPRSEGKPATACPSGALSHYERALGAGARYLSLGRRLETRFHEIRRGDELGDSQGLTPDYRAKTKRARDLYQELVRDYREMRIAFYDQLGAEMRHAGCPTSTGADRNRGGAGESDSTVLDPSDPAAWELDTAIAGESPTGADGKAGIDAPRGGKAKPETAGGAAPAIWIDIDNTKCAQASRLAIDGVVIGRVAGLKKLSVRTRAGPRELCVLPLSDKRSCGDPGTLRRAYVYEGWTLTVRCEK